MARVEVHESVIWGCLLFVLCAAFGFALAVNGRRTYELREIELEKTQHACPTCNGTGVVKEPR